MNTVHYEKLRLVLRYKLQGLALADARYHQALRALEYFEKLHGSETARNGTKAFYHQLNILSFAMTQHKNLEEPWNVYVIILGHDGYEDYQGRAMEMKQMFPLHFDGFRRISKIRDGVKLSNDEYFEDMVEDVNVVVAKGLDRIQNFSRMAGVFSMKKQESYAQEGREYFIPMLKIARRAYPEHESILEMLKTILMVQIHQTDHLVEALKKLASTKDQEVIPCA